MFLEGYFVFTPDFYKKISPVYLAEVWKEYSKGDSRYAARNSAVVSIEGFTAVLEGPFCLLCLYVIAAKKSYMHVLQLSISLGQLYGTIVYFMTSYWTEIISRQTNFGRGSVCERGSVFFSFSETELKHSHTARRLQLNRYEELQYNACLKSLCKKGISSSALPYKLRFYCSEPLFKTRRALRVVLEWHQMS